MDLIQLVYDNLIAIPRPQKVVVGYSGGLDSQVLLHCLKVIRDRGFNIPILAVHCHHGLLPQANDWAQFCQQQAEEWAIPIQIVRLKIPQNSGESLEALARKTRYAALAHLMQAGDVLCTAHHQDDQAETILLHLIRGAGVAGLAAMPVVKKFEQGYLLRPLLTASRDEIHAYAKGTPLTFLEDPSNQDPRFDRNFLRHEIIPKLTNRWPKVSCNLARSAALCGEWLDYARAPLQETLNTLKNADHSLDLLAWDALPRIEKHLLLREWLQHLTGFYPTQRRLFHIMQQVIYSATDACPQYRYNQHWIRRFQQKLYCINLDSVDCYEDRIPWDLQNNLTLPGNLGILQSLQVVGAGIRNSAITAACMIRFWREGDRFITAAGTKKLKKCFHEWRVPPWMRRQIPLLVIDQEVICVIGYGVASPYQATTNEPAIQLSWVLQTP